MIKNSDLRFLAYLRKNSRQTLTEISKKTNIPISTLYDKLRSHEGNVIKKHTTLIDFSKLGFNCKAHILFKATRESRDKLGSYLKAHPSVSNLYKINNGYDFLAEGVFSHVKDLEDFMDDIEKNFGLQEKRTHYVIEDLKREEFLQEEAA